MASMKRIDATKGNLTRQIFSYTIPLILSTILQNFFNVADKAVLGNMAGTIAVASLAATGTISSLIINGAVGLSTGTAIVLARFVGAKDEKNIRSTIDTSLITAFAFGLIVAVAGFFLTPVFLTATGCPEECYEGAMLYMRITLAAAPATLLYNYGSAILRSLGDTQRPLVYVTVAGVVNVGLNILLCLVLPEKVVAVAVATVASTVVSCFLVLYRLMHIEDSARVVFSKMRFAFPAFARIFRFGIPASISSLAMPLGNLQITAAINSYGAEAIAGHSAAISVENFVHAFVTGFGSSSMTFIGQNIGAQKVDRVRKSFWLCLLYGTVLAGSLGVLTYLTGEFWLGIILGSSSTAAIEYGMLRLFYVILFVFLYAISNVLTGAMKAFGYPMLTTITNLFFTLGFRVFWMSVIYPTSTKFSTVMLCYTVSWVLNLIFYIIFTMVVYRRYVKTGACKKI